MKKAKKNFIQRLIQKKEKRSKKMISFFLGVLVFQIFSIFFLLFNLGIVSAADLSFKTQVPIGEYTGGDITPESIGEYIKAVYEYAIGVVGIVAAAVIMWAGFSWIVAGGNQQKITEAKAWLSSALLGLALVMTSFLILNTINPALVRVNPIEPPEIQSASKSGKKGGGSESDKNFKPKEKRGCCKTEVGGTASPTAELKTEAECNKAKDIASSTGATVSFEKGKIPNEEKTDCIDRPLGSSDGEVANAVVRIIGQKQISPGMVSVGTGMILDKRGYILTNAHVAMHDQLVNIHLANGDVVYGEVLGFDKKTDSAIIKINPGDYSTVSIGDSDNLSPGDGIKVFGHPGGSVEIVKTEGKFISRFSGIGAGDENIGYGFGEGETLQHGAITRKGNSGGPLIDDFGQVVGLVNGGSEKTRTYIAVPINRVKGRWPQYVK